MAENTNFFGGEGFLIFALLLLFMGNGFGGLGAVGGKQIATTDDLNFGRLEQQVRANENYIQQMGTNLGNGICNLGYTMAEKINNSNSSILGAINGLSAKMDAEKMADMREKITRLENEKLFCGIPRINPFAYGVYPYGNSGCGCTGNF